MLSTDVSRERLVQLRDEEARLVGPAEEAEQGEREEQQRHEREQREVGDHRREVGSAVGEELGEQFAHAQLFAAAVSFSRDGERPESPRRADRDLLAGAGCSPLRRRRERCSASTLPDEARRGIARRAPGSSASRPRSLRRRGAKLTQLEAATGDGSVFIVREAERLIAAVTVAGADGRARVLRPEESALRSRRPRSRSKRKAPAKKRRPKAKPSGSS